MVLAAAVGLPVFLMAMVSLWRSSMTRFLIPAWSLDNYRLFFTEAVYPSLLLKTFRIATTVTLLTLVAGYPLAFLLARQVRRWKAVLILLVMIPFWTSYLVRTFTWLPILGKKGVLNHVLQALGLIREPVEAFLYNEFSLHIAFIYVYLPFVIIPIYLSLERIDRSLFEAASDLGARGWQTFWRVTFPLSLPGVLGGGLLVFITCLGAYVAPKMLGGPSGVMFGNMVEFQFGGNVNWPLGAALAVILVLAVFAVIGLAARHIELRRIFVEE
jgi:spermidine/putrescine transport system permease protein